MPSGMSSVHGAGSKAGTSTIRVSVRPSTSTTVWMNPAARTAPFGLRGIRAPGVGELAAGDRAAGGVNLAVRAPAPQLAAHRLAYVVVARMRAGREQGVRRDELARRPEAALRGVVRDECALERREGTGRASCREKCRSRW